MGSIQYATRSPFGRLAVVVVVVVAAVVVVVVVVVVAVVVEIKAIESVFEEEHLNEAVEAA